MGDLDDRCERELMEADRSSIRALSAWVDQVSTLIPSDAVRVPDLKEDHRVILYVYGIVDYLCGVAADGVIDRVVQVYAVGRNLFHRAVTTHSNASTIIDGGNSRMGWVSRIATWSICNRFGVDAGIIFGIIPNPIQSAAMEREYGGRAASVVQALDALHDGVPLEWAASMIAAGS